MRAITRASLIGLVFTLFTVLLIALAVRGSLQERCEVCVTFLGRTACREAVGATREEAVRTATDNACAFVASGMTQTVQCTTSPPDRVTCPAE